MSFILRQKRIPSRLNLIKGSFNNLRKQTESNRTGILLQQQIVRHVSKSTKNTSSIFPISSSSFALSPNYKRSFSSQTDGDRDLSNFLKEEILYEEENVMDLPKFKDFKVEMDKTLVTLEKQANNETIIVSFDINDSVNVNEEGILDDESYSEEEVNLPDIISYPSFNVKIKKPSGQTLHFNCTCSTDSTDEDENAEDDTDSADGQFDIFRFDAIKIYNGDSNLSNVFEAETETMDGELYSMLMTLLLERGITGNFVNDLLDFSTSVEHRHYLTFLKSLQEFVDHK